MASLFCCLISKYCCIIGVVSAGMAASFYAAPWTARLVIYLIARASIPGRTPVYPEVCPVSGENLLKAGAPTGCERSGPVYHNPPKMESTFFLRVRAAKRASASSLISKKSPSCEKLLSFHTKGGKVVYFYASF